MAAAVDASAGVFVGQRGHHLGDVETYPVAPEDSEIRTVSDRDDRFAVMFSRFVIVDRAGCLPRCGIGKAVSVVFDIDAMEMCVIGECLVLSVRKCYIELAAAVTLGPVSENETSSSWR